MTDEELKKLCHRVRDAAVDDRRIPVSDSYTIARALHERLDRPEVTREQVAEALALGNEQNGAPPWDALDKYNKSRLMDQADAILRLIQPR